MVRVSALSERLHLAILPIKVLIINISSRLIFVAPHLVRLRDTGLTRKLKGRLKPFEFSLLSFAILSVLL